MIIVLPGKVGLYIAERIFIMDESEKYYPYSQYLKERYGEKVYIWKNLFCCCRIHTLQVFPVALLDFVFVKCVWNRIHHIIRQSQVHVWHFHFFFLCFSVCGMGEWGSWEWVWKGDDFRAILFPGRIRNVTGR